VASGQAVRPDQHGGAHDLGTAFRAGAVEVVADEVALQLGGLGRGDLARAAVAEPGRDPVEGQSEVDQPELEAVRALHPRQCFGVEVHPRPHRAPHDVRDLARSQVVTVQENRVPHVVEGRGHLVASFQPLDPQRRFT
jgi:hypothetical protein